MATGLYDVPNDELLNGLILGHASGTVGAANRLQVAAALFGVTIIPSFLGHPGSREAREALLVLNSVIPHLAIQALRTWPSIIYPNSLLRVFSL